MINIYEKEQIVDAAVFFLKTYREQLRKNLTDMEGILPIVAGSLMTIIQSEQQDRKIVDVFEGFKSWKEKEYLDPPYTRPEGMISVDLKFEKNAKSQRGNKGFRAS